MKCIGYSCGVYMLATRVFKVIRCWLVVLAAASFGLPAISAAETNPDGSTRFDIKIVPDLAKHAYLLEYPSYLELALENNGIELSVSGKLFIVDPHTAQIKNVMLGDVSISPTLQYTHREGNVFFYKVGMLDVSIPVNIDTTYLKDGMVSVIFPKSSASIVLNKFSKAIGEKMQILANDTIQRRMLRYMDEIGQGKPSGMSENEWAASKILVQGYNRRAFGEAQAVASGDGIDWWFVLILAGVAFLLYLNRDWFKKEKRT